MPSVSKQIVRQFCRMKITSFILPHLFLLLLFSLPVLGADTDQQALNNILQRLVTGSFKEKGLVIGELEKIKDARKVRLMRALLKGRLYYKKADKHVVYIKKTDQGYQITDVLTEAKIGTVEKNELKKISINNKLRKLLRGAIARLNITSDDPNLRLSAVKEIIKNITPESVAILRKNIAAEKNKAVHQVMQNGLALYDINNADKAVRLKAIRILAESSHPEARKRIASILEKTADGSFLEPDLEIRQSAKSALASIDSRLSLYSFIENAFFGLSLGSVLLLAAIGLAITFGVMGVINMAHGELMMIGAYTTYVVQLLMPNHIDVSIFVAIPAAFIIAGLFGIAIERGIIRFLYGRPLETLLATFGVSLVLQQLVRSIFSPLNRAVATPSWMSGSLVINDALSFTYNRLYIVIFSLMVFFALLVLLKKTALGLQIRAVSQNRNMAKAMGIRTEWVDALTFGLGAGIAGIAGVALSQLTNVGPNLGQAYIIDSFMVVVFGGVGNLWGTFVGAISLGILTKFLEPWVGAVLAKIMVLVFIILFIQKRPRGLFPQKGRAAEN